MTSFLNRLKIRIFVPLNKVTDIDLQWYEAVRQDNYPAFEKLFQKYYDPLCRYAQGLLADGSLAEDVVQDMFIHFWENRIKLQVKDSLRAYFYTCIRHRALKNLQKQAIVRKHNPKLTNLSNTSSIPNIRSKKSRKSNGSKPSCRSYRPNV